MKILINHPIEAAKHSKRNNRKSARDIARNLIRCRSSNVYAYGYDIKDDADTGTMYLQFKSPTGGPGDVYRYYDVPWKLYKRFITAPSKGHWFWQYLRDDFRYSKLTGDKRGKLKNAV